MIILSLVSSFCCPLLVSVQENRNQVADQSKDCTLYNYNTVDHSTLLLNVQYIDSTLQWIIKIRFTFKNGSVEHGLVAQG